MPSRKSVTLLLRAQLDIGARRYLNPYLVNGKPKPQWGLLGTKPTHFPGSKYAVRYWLQGKLVFQSVGPDVDVARIEQRKIANKVEGILLGTVAAPESIHIAVADNRLTLRKAVEKYLFEVQRNKSHETWRSYNLALDKFVATCQKVYLEDLTRDDAQAFIQAMQKSGMTNPSICLRLQILSTFLKNMERPQLLKPKEWPRFTPKPVVSYTREELTALFAAANAEERLLYRFFLGSGFRQGEVAVAQYTDIDFARGTILMREKKEFAFSPKSRKPRFVPLPDDLLRDLKARWEAQPEASLIFPTKAGNPQGNMLTPLKRLAYRAGLNCGTCVTDTGKTCRDSACCAKWQLHSFRRSFASLHHNDGGVSSAILKTWLGHHSLTVTERYLDGTPTPAAKAAVNSTFVGLVPAGPVLVKSA